MLLRPYPACPLWFSHCAARPARAARALRGLAGPLRAGRRAGRGRGGGRGAAHCPQIGKRHVATGKRGRIMALRNQLSVHILHILHYLHATRLSTMGTNVR